MPPKRKQGSASDTQEKKETKKVKKEDSTSDAEAGDGKKWSLKLLSWNVDGLRAWLKKDGLSVFKTEDPDIVCLQETKCNEGKLPEEAKNVEGYKAYFMAGKIEGYSGVALYSKTEPLSVTYGINDDTHDDEGRCITAEYEKFYLVTTSSMKQPSDKADEAVYNWYKQQQAQGLPVRDVPNAGRKLITLDKRMDWDPKFRKYLQELDAKKPVIMCGDLNVAHNEIDLANPKGNKKNAGFTQEERDGFTELLAAGFVDSFRHLYPDKASQYTFWTYMGNCRARNVGWRLDYFVLSKRLIPQLCDNVICRSFLGSDHCPIKLLMQI